MQFFRYTSYITTAALLTLRCLSVAKRIPTTKLRVNEGGGGKRKAAWSAATNALGLAKTPQQKQYVEYLRQSNVSLILAVGCAGTGKTFLACHEAAQALKRGDVDRIVLTRPIVPVEGEDGLGFLPGSLESKMDPWTRPINDVLVPLLENMNLQKQVQMIPLMYMRGRTFDRTFVIADEMQNSTPGQMLMLVTRIGNHSRLVITGDPLQTDRVHASENGLSDLEKRLERHAVPMMDSRIRRVSLTAQDVQRSALVTELLEHVYSSTPPIIQTPSIQNKMAKNSTMKVAAANKTQTTTSRINQDCALIIDDPYLRRRPAE